MAEMVKKGFLRARVNGETVDLENAPELDKQKKHTIEVVVDRLVVRRDDETRRRLADSLETATQVGNGLVTIAVARRGGRRAESDETLSTSYACPDCGTSLAEITPRLFSFNSPYGACPTCSGLGTVQRVDPDRLVPDPSLSIRDGAIALWKPGSANWRLRQIEQLAKALKFSIDVPWAKLPEDVRDRDPPRLGRPRDQVEVEVGEGGVRLVLLLQGARPDPRGEVQGGRERGGAGRDGELHVGDALPGLQGAAAEARGARGPRGRALDRHAHGDDARGRAGVLREVRGHPRETEIAGKILKEIRDRLGFLNDVGIGYLSLSRASATLSGGEAQRIRLATQIGSKLMGVLYVLDEPSIGLHAKDNRKLIETLEAMRDLGNTVVVVEHDEETIRSRTASWTSGPGAGIHGGEVVGEGTAAELAAFPRSLTGKYLSGELRIETPRARRTGTGRSSPSSARGRTTSRT